MLRLRYILISLAILNQILCFIKLNEGRSLANNKIDELDINKDFNAKIKANEISYFYLRTTDMSENANFGSIEFKGISNIDDIIIKGMNLHYDYIDASVIERFKNGQNVKNYKLNYDSHYNIYELLFENDLPKVKDKSNNYFLFSIEGNKNMDLKLKPLAFPNVEVIEPDKAKEKNLKYARNQIIYHQIKINDKQFRKKTVLIYTENACHIKFAGNLDSQNKQGNIILERYNLNVFKFDRQQTSDIRITFKFKCDERYHARVLIESTSTTVALFQEKQLTSRIFQTVFNYMQSFNFYYIGNFKEIGENFELFPIQKIGSFKFYFKTHISDYILPTEFDKELEPHHFYPLNKKLIIIYIVPILPGKFDIKIFQNLQSIKMENDGITNVKIEKRVKKKVIIPENESKGSVYLTIKKYGEAIVKCEFPGEVINIDNKPIYKELTKEADLSFYSEQDALVELTTIYTPNLYQVVKEKESVVQNLKSIKGIAIQLEKSDKYYSPHIHLNIPPEISNVNFRFYVGANFAKSEKFIPLISKGGNQVVMTINDENREEFIQIAHNPYDESKVNPKDDDNYFYYVIEFIEAKLEKLNIVVEYMDKNYNNKDTIRPNSKYTLKNNIVKVEDSYDQNYMRIVTIKCKNNIENKLKMKYEKYDMWSEFLYNKYTFFELSALYNGIGFDLQNKKNSVLFSYSYSNQLIDIKNFEFELISFYEKKEYSKSIQLKENRLTSSKIEIGNYKDAKTKMYLLNPNQIAINYDDICFLNSLSGNNDATIIKEFESELVFNKEEFPNGNWYLVVVKEFHNPVYFDMIVYSEKVIIDEGIIRKDNKIEFKELKINEQKEVNEKNIYLYLDITKFNGKEGSILFKGEIPDEYQINTVEINIKQGDINNDELYERFKAGFQEPNQFIKDPVTNDFELFYGKTYDNEKDRRIILLIEIKLKESVGLKITPLSSPKELEIDEMSSEKKYRLNCSDSKNDICYYKVKIKPLIEEFGKKYVLIYHDQKTNKRLIYKGHLNPIISGEVREEVFQNRKHQLIVFNYDSYYNEEISIIFKFYKKENFEILIEITTTKVVVFNSLSEQIFESLFTYDAQFPFYYVGTYPEEAVNWGLYNEQNFGTFELSMTTTCANKILPIENEPNFPPNSLYHLISNFIIIYVKSESPGNLKLRFFKLDNDIEMNGLNHVYLENGSKSITIKNSNEKMNLHIKLIGKGKVTLNKEKDIVDEVFMEYNKKTIELSSSDKILITIIVTQDNLYEVFKPSNAIIIKNKKNILFEYPNDLEYGSTIIDIKSDKQLTYFSHYGYTNDSKYFPEVQLGRNPLRNELNELNTYQDSIFFDLNPYDQFHVDPKKHKFYYGIELQDEKDSVLYVSFIKNEKNPMYKYELKEKEFNYISNDHFPKPAATNKDKMYIEIMCYFCKKLNSNSLFLKYEGILLYQRHLTDQFNFFKFPVLYNGMHFELKNNDDSAIFYYQYSDNIKQINQDFINDIYKLDFNPINENYITLDGTKLKLKDHPLKKYTIHLKVFLLNREYQEFAYNYDNLCYLTQIEVEKDQYRYKKNVIVLSFDKEIDLKDYKSKWFLIVVGEYKDIIGTRLILYREKVIISDKIEIEKVNFRELKVGGDKVKLNDRIDYFYIDIKKMGKENYGNEGSIVLKGLEKEEEGSKIAVHIAYDSVDKYDEKSFFQRIKSFDRKALNLEYDKKNKIVEFYYEKTSDLANYIIIQIENYSDKKELEIQATDFVIYKEIDEKDLKSINSLKCNKKDLPCYYQYKIKANEYVSKYIIFYSKSLDRLVYKGSINPSNSYSNKTKIIDDNVCYFVVLKYESGYDPNIVTTIKFYNSNKELNDVKLKMDYSDLKVVRFIGKKRDEKIFQSIFTYGAEFPFYFLQCYSEEKEKYEMYNEQPFNSFNIFYKNKFEDNILPTESDKEIKPNSFLEVIESDIMLINPLSAGNLNLRIYPMALLDEYLKKESLYHVHIQSNQKRTINLPFDSNKEETYFISVTSINKAKFKFNGRGESLDSITEVVKQKTITLESSEELLVVIVIRVNEKLYKVVSPKYDEEEKVFTVKDNKLILIEYDNNDDYGKTILELTANFDFKYTLSEGFALSDKYFPQISQSKSNIFMEFNELNNYIENVQMEFNPYHDLRLKNNQKKDYKYYYGIEFEDDSIIDVKLKYVKMDKPDSYQSPNDFKVMNKKNTKIYPEQSTDNYISMFVYLCEYSDLNKLNMKYNEEIIWSADLEYLFNFYKLPLLYKYIYFSQDQQNNDILFSFKYNTDGNLDMSFIDKIRNYTSSKIEINKILKITEPIAQYHVSNYIVYLLPKESKSNTQFTNLCYLNNLKENNGIKILKESGNEIAFNSISDGNYYISIIAQYNNPIPAQLPLYFGKATIKNGEILEEKIEFLEIKQGIKITESISNYYINLDKLDLEGNSEGSLLFKGINENNVKKYKIKIAYCKKNENKNDKIRSDGTITEFVYDRKFDLYEIYYSKRTKDDEIVLIQINRADDETSIEIQFSDIKYNKISEKDFQSKIKKLDCKEDQLCYYKFEFDQTKFDTDYKYFIIYSETFNRLFYKGVSINPTYDKNSIEEIVENNECYIVSFGFKKNEDNKISIIAKLYGKIELISKSEITNEKVVFFHGEVRKERLFQTFFPYENYFSFYFLECYKSSYSTFEIYPEQDSKEFEFVYHTKLNDYILPTEKDKKILSNTFTELNSRYEIIHIIPKGPGNLNLRIYQKDLKKLEKNSLNTVHLNQDILSIFQIPISEYYEDKDIYISLTKLNSNDDLELNINEEKNTITLNSYENHFPLKNTKISLRAKSSMLVTIVLNYEYLYHVINAQNAKSKINSSLKYYLIQYENSYGYSSSNITIKSSKEVSYKMTFGFSKSAYYFPLVSNSANPLRLRFYKNHLIDYVYQNKNPYDQFKMNTELSFYYALEFDEPVEISVQFDYINKISQKLDLKENKFGIISKNNKISIERTYNKSHILLFVHNCSESNYELKMKYENEDLWTNKISNKYNYYNIPILHNGIHFEQSNEKANTFFSYKFHNNDINEKNLMEKIKSFKDNNDYISLKTSGKVTELSYKTEPIKNSTLVRTTIYLLKDNEKNQQNSRNLCYLNSDDSKNANELKKLNFVGKTYKFQENNELDGKWYMTIESEYLDNVATKFIVYNSKVEIKKGLINPTSESKGNTKTIIIIVLIVLVCIAIALAVIFLLKKSKDDILNEIPTQNISLIHEDKGTYTRV